MKKTTFLVIMMVDVNSTYAQLQLKAPDVGVFRACKMAALHNTLSVNGFVMEMTTEDNRGGKTLMKTVSLNDSEKYTVELKGVEMNTAINKVNYFTF